MKKGTRAMNENLSAKKSQPQYLLATMTSDVTSIEELSPQSSFRR